MPLARIDINKDASPELIRIVSEAIYNAMVQVADVPLQTSAAGMRKLAH